MLGLKKVFKRQKHSHFSEFERRMIIEDYLQSGLTKRAIWEKYTGSRKEHGLLLYWMYKYGYTSANDVKSSKIITFAGKTLPVKEEDNKQELSEFEILQLQKRNSDLEKQLRESQMESLAWQMMIELAEKEFNISIKKKFNTKPSKK